MAAKKKSTKTTKKVTRRKSTKSAKKMAMPEMTMPAMEPMSNMGSSMPTMGGSKFMRYALWIILLALLTYKFGPWLFPARVGMRPISRFEIWSQMEKVYGQQTLDDIVNERVLDAAIAKAGVTVDQAKVDEQFATLEEQFQAVGGLDEALSQRGLTRKELEKQIRTQLSVEEILKDEITPTDDEVMKAYDSGADTMYADQTLDEVKDQIESSLKESKLRDAFLAWFSEAKKDIQTTNFGL